jgi:hypothetical protein
MGTRLSITLPVGPGLYLNMDGYVIVDVLEILLKKKGFIKAIRKGNWKKIYGWFILDEQLRGLETGGASCPENNDYWADIKQDGINLYRYGKLSETYQV